MEVTNKNFSSASQGLFNKLLAGFFTYSLLSVLLSWDLYVYLNASIDIFITCKRVLANGRNWFEYKRRADRIMLSESRGIDKELDEKGEWDIPRCVEMKGHEYVIVFRVGSWWNTWGSEELDRYRESNEIWRKWSTILQATRTSMGSKSISFLKKSGYRDTGSEGWRYHVKQRWDKQHTKKAVYGDNDRRRNLVLDSDATGVKPASLFALEDPCLGQCQMIRVQQLEVITGLHYQQDGHDSYRRYDRSFGTSWCAFDKLYEIERVPQGLTRS